MLMFLVVVNLWNRDIHAPELSCVLLPPTLLHATIITKFKVARDNCINDAFKLGKTIKNEINWT